MSHSAEQDPRKIWTLTLAALGIVYGDIGTSPLYAMRECFHSAHAVPATPENIFGVLSLILWTLVLVVTIKYLVFVMRADNHGEGGILALMALVRPKERLQPYTWGWGLVVLGLFGSALLYGDGVLTPAISVLSAVEGLGEVTHLFDPYVVPISIAILVGLFAAQHRGTASVGVAFGPITLTWFACIAALGVRGILLHPDILQAVYPWHGLNFLSQHGWHGFLVLGGVFLVCTGGEALYADMGHFGRRPIQRAWALVVLPALVLNYLGQGALLLAHPDEAAHPFFALVPRPLLLPMVILATAAAVIASQALISGAFSLTRQATQLGYWPRMTIEHTSEAEIGQIYIGPVNWALCLATIGIVIGFGSSSALASAYGVAVATTMVITTILWFVLAYRIWRWPLWIAGPTALVFLVIEVAFWSANMTKFLDGGWFPILLGAGVFTLMATWHRGREILGDRLLDQSIELEVLQRIVDEDKPYRVPRTAVFMTASQTRLPPALLRNLVHNRVLHERIVLVTVVTEEVPHVAERDRVTVESLGSGFWRVSLRYGFMQQPDVPRSLEACAAQGLAIDLDDVTYFAGRETILATDRPGMSWWREVLFGVLTNNAQRSTAYFRIPPALVVEIGTQIEI